MARCWPLVPLSDLVKASRRCLSVRQRIRGQASASTNMSHTNVWSRFAGVQLTSGLGLGVVVAAEYAPPPPPLLPWASKLANASRIYSEQVNGIGWQKKNE